MPIILQTALPEALQNQPALPGTRPCPPDGWLMVDDAYAAQMAYRAELLRDKRAAVFYQPDDVLEPTRELLDEVLGILPAMGFTVTARNVTCPDGRTVAVDHDAPLLTLGQLVQEDLCILEKRGSEHVLTGAVLCFPASWRLADKVGRPRAAAFRWGAGGPSALAVQPSALCQPGPASTCAPRPRCPAPLSPVRTAVHCTTSAHAGGRFHDPYFRRC